MHFIQNPSIFYASKTTQFKFKHSEELSLLFKPVCSVNVKYIEILFYYYYFIPIHKNHILYSDYIKLNNIL